MVPLSDTNKNHSIINCTKCFLPLRVWVHCVNNSTMQNSCRVSTDAVKCTSWTVWYAPNLLNDWIWHLGKDSKMSVSCWNMCKICLPKSYLHYVWDIQYVASMFFKFVIALSYYTTFLIVTTNLKNNERLRKEPAIYAQVNKNKLVKTMIVCIRILTSLFVEVFIFFGAALLIIINKFVFTIVTARIFLTRN